jgi:hypothetical protein
MRLLLDILENPQTAQSQHRDIPGELLPGETVAAL